MDVINVITFCRPIRILCLHFKNLIASSNNDNQSNNEDNNNNNDNNDNDNSNDEKDASLVAHFLLNRVIFPVIAQPFAFGIIAGM